MPGVKAEIFGASGALSRRLGAQGLGGTGCRGGTAIGLEPKIEECNSPKKRRKWKPVRYLKSTEVYQSCDVADELTWIKFVGRAPGLAAPHHRLLPRHISVSLDR
jgi:hypothetical protein